MYQQWTDKQYLKTYHPTTTTTPSFSIAPVHKEALKMGVIGAVGGAMTGAVTCPPTPAYPACVLTRTAVGALAGAQAVYTSDVLKNF